ncbi:MAG: response regulator transcription factor [Saprospiraceae bacterium]|nr:response regulator transcription factor [Saprospiraceae bacterium]
MENVNKKSTLLLSKRELEIMDLIAQGLESKQIASLLYVSVHTVETHRRNIIKRVGAKNIIEVTVKLIKLGLI